MRPWKFVLPLLASSLCFAAQPNRITAPIDSSQMVALNGSLHRMALPQFDQGPLDSSWKFGYVTLGISPTSAQQATLNQFLAQLQDHSSPNFHKWLTPEQYADRFGLSQGDVDKITDWLEGQGFTVLRTARARNSIVFNGTAIQVESAFKTEMHRYSVNGEKHIANSTLLSVPAALSGIVTTIRGLTDFRPKPMYQRAVSGPNHGPHPTYTGSIPGDSTPYFIAPGDIATIYDLSPLYNAATPIDGTGEKLAIIGQTDVYYADLADFRSGFGLPSFTCTTASGLISSCNTSNFEYVLVGTDQPVSVGDLAEADLDLEWSAAIAPGAQIIYVNTPISSNQTSGGVIDALEYAIDNNEAPVISMSYGACEEDGTFENELQPASAYGITLVIAAGDTGSAECDYNPPGTSSSGTLPARPYSPAQGGLAVSYPASSPQVTGVGGTSIPSSDYDSTYWGSTNESDGGSALATLIGQEVSWNDDEAIGASCLADPGPSGGFCDPHPGVAVTSAQTFQQDYWISEGGGGVSNCATMSGGLCQAGFTRPPWQASLTIPNLGSPQSTYRFVPDVSLLASPNYPGYIVCTPQEEVVTNSTSTTSTCSPGDASGITTAVDTYVSIFGGTSVSTPVFAGMVTLLNQYLGTSALGNINPTLYGLAASPSNGAFHQVKSGDSNVYCQEGDPAGQPADVICPSTGATPGIIGFSASNFDATTGYNLVTGLGSVDANALAVAWEATLVPDFQISLGAFSPASVHAGQSATATVTLTAIARSTGMVVNFSPSSCSGLPTGATCSFNPISVNFDGTDPVTTQVTVTTLANMTVPASPSITITPTNSPNTTTTPAVTLAVSRTNQAFSLAATNGASTFSVTAGATASVGLTVAGTGSPSQFTPSTLPLSYSCVQSSLPTEAQCTFSPTSGQAVSASNLTLNIVTTPPTSQLRSPLGRGSRIFYALLLPGMFGIVIAAGSRTRGVRLLGLIVILGFSTLWLGSCGGGGSNASQSNPGTPAGTYKVVVNATTGGANPLTGTLTINLTVTQ